MLWFPFPELFAHFNNKRFEFQIIKKHLGNLNNNSNVMRLILQQNTPLLCCLLNFNKKICQIR